MPLRNKELRRCPDEYWTLENLEVAIKTEPLNENDVLEIFKAGHRPIYNNSKVDKGLCSKYLNEIHINRSNPKEEMLTFIHELLHLVFSYQDKPNPKYLINGSIRGDIREKFEKIIEVEEQWIYNKDVGLILRIQSISEFPKGEVYENPH